MLPANYTESAGMFQSAALLAGAQVQSYPIEADTSDTIALATHTALLGKDDASNLVIVASGTHGVEAYAGAACQLHFLRQWPVRFGREDVAFLLVHAVNPWGYHQDRRVTRENIDLNRNFVDFDALPPDAGYAACHDLLVGDYRPLPQGWLNRLSVLARVLHPAQRRRLQAGVTAGQYRFPDGLFYGGVHPAESRVTWERIVSEAAARHERLFLLDIHTGLGRFGCGELMSHLPAASADFRSVNAWFDGQLRSMADGASVSPALQGMLSAAFVNACPTRRHAVGLEFGTCSPLAVLAALRADQWAWAHRHELPAHRQVRVRHAMRRAFVPDDAGWQKRVIARFDEVMERIVAGLPAA